MAKSSSIFGRIVDNLLYETVDEPESSPDKAEGAEDENAASALERHISAMVAESGPAMVGKLFFVDLADIRERYADKWDRLAKIIFPTAERIIQENIGDRDFFTQVEDSYFVVFADLAPEEAEARCAKIRSEIERWLFGESSEEIPPLKIKTAVVQVDGSVAFEEIEALPVIAGMASGLPEGIEFIYTAMWNARRKIVSSYLCLPRFEREGEEPLVGDAFLGDDCDDVSLADLDKRTLENVRQDLLQLAQKKRRVFVAFPVHYSTLTNPDTISELATTLQAIPQTQRRMLVVEIVGIPEDVEPILLQQVTAAMRHFSRAVLARSPLERADFQTYTAAGIVGAGADLTGMEGDEADIIEMMNQFAEKANDAGLRTYVHGLRSLSLTTAAVCAGFDHVDGDAVTSIVDEPPGIYPLDPGKLYADLAQSQNASTPEKS